MSIPSGLNADAAALHMIVALATAATPEDKAQAMAQILEEAQRHDPDLVIFALASHGSTLSAMAAAARRTTVKTLLSNYAEASDLARLDTDADSDSGEQS